MGRVDNNHVGTDEWMKLNKAMGSENIVCVNLGLATIMDAVYWVEYCNYNTEHTILTCGLRMAIRTLQCQNLGSWE